MTTAPDFVLPGIDGGPVRLSDVVQSGPDAVLLLFVHAECPTAALTMQRLGRHAQALEHRGVRLLCVAEETPEDAARLARRHGVSATVVVQQDPYEASAAFGVDTVPTAILIGRNGEILDRAVGWSQPDRDRMLPVDIAADPPAQKPGCSARAAHDGVPSDSSTFDELEDMFERGWTDGLPVVPPTPERVEAMLGDRDAGSSLGRVPPAMGEATLEWVAACAVLAGCRAGYFPTVLAAVQLVLDPAFNVHGQAVTTSPPGQILIVNGPVRHDIGLQSGMGALGPGARANLTIGRAVRLVIQLTGGGAAGGLDRATLGHPGKVSFCIAENEEQSPWEPLQVERGFARDQSTVTVLAGDAPTSVADHRSVTASELAGTIGWAGATGWSPFMWPLAGTSLFVIGPEHAALLGDAGWTKDDLRSAIYEEVRRPAGELKRGETTPTVEAAGPDELIPKWSGPERIMIIVAGGEAGRFSAVIGPSLGMDAAVLTKEI